MITRIVYLLAPISSFDMSTDGIRHLVGGTNLINYMARIGMTANMIRPYEKAVMDYAQKD